ncbi:MAG: response regulator [Verrucomicrobiota bacterium]
MAQRILVLDDEENYADMLKALLEQHLFLVDSVTEPARALEKLHDTGYELVISDFKMPNMDGADFLHAARDVNPDLPVILVSGLMNTPDLVKVANMGVTLVLEKPIDIQQFITHVKRFVNPATKAEFRAHRQGKGLNQEPDESLAFTQTYPETLKFLSDQSMAFRYFLESLWKAANEQDHIFVSMPIGCEADLVLREVAVWRQFSDQEVRWLDLRHPDTQRATKLLETIASQPDISCLVGVIGFEGATLAQQELMVDCIRESPENLAFLYLIEKNLLDLDHRPINPELLELLEQSLCVMPPLNARLSDLAVYTKRYLPKIAEAAESPERAMLMPDAGAVLLAHDWPGNFAELMDTLRIAVGLQPDGPITREHLAEALERLSKIRVDVAEIASLYDAIKGRQQSIVSSAMRSSGQDIAATLVSLGVDPQAINPDADINNLPLIYPELAN